MILKPLIRRVRTTLFPKAAYVAYEGHILPPLHLRTNGPKFKDNAYYVRTARKEAQRVVERLHCTTESMLLDVGCGPGRLAIGLLSVLGRTNYLGLDVNANAIRWCQQHIERQHPSFRFQHVDVANDRYNRDGVGIDEDFRFDLPAGEFDAIYLYSVFTHMLEADVRAYLREFRRILKPRGRVFLTATVDEGVPRVTVNAPGYVANLMGPLHVVRYEKTFFFSLVKDAGFDVSEFVPFGDARSQSVFFLQRAYE